MDPLLEDSDVDHDVLPLGTQVFSSTVRYGRTFWILAMALGVLFPVLFISGVASSGAAQAALLSLAFCFALISGIVMYVLASRAKERHTRQRASGEWHEGVIVFSSGDVVVRFAGVFSDVDITVESRYLSRADIKPAFNPLRCSTRRYLQLYYMGMDTKLKVASIPEDDLTDDVATIATFINDAKSKNLSTIDL